MTQNPEKEWFGEKQVTPDEKTGLVIDVFDSVARKYDIMNDLMSGGLHRLWKDRLIRMIRPRAGMKFLDVAGGTGDIAFRIKKYLNPSPDPRLSLGSPSPIGRGRDPRSGRVRVYNLDEETKITVFDLNRNMLDVGRDRAVDQGWLNDFEWITGNAESLPFPDNSFDVYTIAFGLRNVTHIDTALKEAFRVLKPGGRFYCLEFSRVDQPLLSKAYDAWSFYAIPRIGKTITGDSDSYQYLVESIRKFPSQRKLTRRLEDAGFAAAKYWNMSGGIVAIHRGIKA